jgi:MFS family permease
MVGPQAVIGEIVSPRERGRYLSYIGAAYVVAAVGGPVLGGLIVEGLGWRWIFALYPPLGAVAFAVLAVTLRLPRPTGRSPIDYAGAATLAAAVVGVVLFGQTRHPTWLILAVVAAAAWLISTRFATDPILPLRLFRDRGFAIPVAISFLVGFALFGTLTYLPAYLQVALGLSASSAGLVVTAMMAGVLTTTVLSGRLITRTGRYKAYPVVGAGLAAGCMALLAIRGSDSGAALLTGVMALIGLGVRLRQIGASAGVAVAGALISTTLTDQVPAAAALSQAMPIIFGLMSPLLALAFGLAVLLPARPLRTTAYVEETV